MFDIFGDYSVWKLPRGKAREVSNDRVNVTWYVNNKLLILKGDVGEGIKLSVTRALEAKRTATSNKLDIYSKINVPQQLIEVDSLQIPRNALVSNDLITPVDHTIKDSSV